MKKYLVFFFVLFSFFACEDWDLAPRSFPEIETTSAETSINPTIVTLSGNISGLLDEDFVPQYGHVWALATSPSPTLEENLGQSSFPNKGNGPFVTDVSGLSPGQTYQYRAYFVYEGEVRYESTSGQFNTTELLLGIRINDIIQPPGSQEPIVNAAIVNLVPGLPITSYGITWSSDPEPTIESDLFVSNQGFISSEPIFLFNNKIFLGGGSYYVRPYLVLGSQPFYGQERTFQPAEVWEPRAQIPGTLKAHPYNFVIGDKAYIGAVEAPDFWEYNPETDSWTQKADFPGTPRKHGVTFTINGKGYLSTGGDYNCGSFASFWLKDLWEYDPANDSWTQKADLPGEARYGAAGFAVGDKGYIGTGQLGQGVTLSDFWEYDPTSDSWTQRADYPGGERTYAAAFNIGDRGYMGTGFRRDNLVQDQVRDFYEYNPDLDQWTRKANFGDEGRAFCYYFSVGGKGYIGGGYDDQRNFKNDLWEYNPTFNIWSKKPDLPAPPRIAGTGFGLAGKGYVGAGCGLYDFWVYVPGEG